MTVSAPFEYEKYQECARLVRDCAEIFSGPNLSEHGMAVYLNAIHCTDADKVIEALKYWLYNDDSFPAPVDIRHRIVRKIRAEEEALDMKRREADKQRYEEFIAQATAEPAETTLTAAETGRD